MGVSQHRFDDSQSTIGRNLEKRRFTRKKKDQRRNTMMKINNNEQNPTVQKLSPDCQLMLGDEKYLTLSGNVSGNSRYYSSEPLSAPTNK